MSQARRVSSSRPKGAGGQSTKANVVRIKIISMGEGGCGKSCLIKRYCEGKFVQRYISTIGVDFGVKPILMKDLEVKVNFWDLSGHPEFFEVRNEFYKDSQGGILVYDVGSRKSFESLENWLQEAGKFGAGNIPLVVCANKCDKRRVVTEEEGAQWAEAHGFRYYDTSANSGQNVNQLFEELFGEVVQQVAGGR